MREPSQFAQERRQRRQIRAEANQRKAQEKRTLAMATAITAWWDNTPFQPALVTAAEMKRRWGAANAYAPALRSLGWTSCRVRSHNRRLYAWLPPGTASRTKPLKRERLPQPLKPPRLRRVGRK